MDKLYFTSDYMEGAHPAILQRLAETNLVKSAGYGSDGFSESARQKIREACRAPEAEIHFLAGGTQANATVISTMLKPWQGVIAAQTGHVALHEAGAIEAGGHKVILLPQRDGKLSADDVRRCLEEYEADENREHMVEPGMVYLSQPTELGTLYSLAELQAISTVCREHGVSLYADGARLAYALACPENNVTLPDLAALCDAFYIGGTKCGALFGEALVITNERFKKDFRYMIKQRGGMLAKGRLLGIQFLGLMTDGRYLTAAAKANRQAQRIRAAFEQKGIPFMIPSPTNQQFPVLTDGQLAALAPAFSWDFWEKTPDGRSAVRFCTSWATADEAVDALVRAVQEL